jgi:hypothetical protein
MTYSEAHQPVTGGPAAAIPRQFSRLLLPARVDQPSQEWTSPVKRKSAHIANHTFERSVVRERRIRLAIEPTAAARLQRSTTLQPLCATRYRPWDCAINRSGAPLSLHGALLPPPPRCQVATEHLTAGMGHSLN